MVLKSACAGLIISYIRMLLVIYSGIKVTMAFFYNSSSSAYSFCSLLSPNGSLSTVQIAAQTIKLTHSGVVKNKLSEFSEKEGRERKKNRV